MDGTRIQYLDGLRGLAIVLVIGFHAYARWPDIVPYGDVFAEFPLFKYGWLGVQLFFLISGFVILMTLEKCSSAGEFLRRRWIRLFPAMAICTLIIFISADIFRERPAGTPTVLSALPGLLFVEPSWLMTVLNVGFPPLEGAFWSLYVEFKFYFVAAAVYFSVTRKNFSLVIFGLFLLAAALSPIANFPLTSPILKAGKELSFQHFGYFAAGAEIYLAVKTGRRFHLIRGTLMALVAPLGTIHSIGSCVAAAFISMAFVAVMHFRQLQVVMATRSLVFIGFVSYPLYLLHENLMIASVIKMAGFPIPAPMLPLLAVSGIVALAYGISAYGEVGLRRLLTRRHKSLVKAT